MRKAIAFIPARGGSKGIPGKNIKLIAGKPLISYVIESALGVDAIDHVVVSTDSKDIEDVVRNEYFDNEKCQIFHREPATATDEATTELAMLDFAERTDIEFDDLILIQATSPLIESVHFREGYEKYLSEQLGGLVSVVRQKRFFWDTKGPLNYEPTKRPRRQDFDGHLVENGAFYITSRKKLLQTKCRISEPYGVYEMPEESYFEIDEPNDWGIVEQLIKQKKNAGKSIKLPEKIDAVVLDFDGVFTDNKVIVFQDGEEAIICDRGDGMGIELLRKAGIPVWVLSKEQNPVLKARCKKLKIPCVHGVDDKWPLLQSQLKKKDIDPAHVIYVGNDVNDIECMSNVGCGVAVADSKQDVLSTADYTLSSKGGNGAIRELCEIILK